MTEIIENKDIQPIIEEGRELYGKVEDIDIGHLSSSANAKLGSLDKHILFQLHACIKDLSTKSLLGDNNFVFNPLDYKQAIYDCLAQVEFKKNYLGFDFRDAERNNLTEKLDYNQKLLDLFGSSDEVRKLIFETTPADIDKYWKVFSPKLTGMSDERKKMFEEIFANEFFINKFRPVIKKIYEFSKNKQHVECMEYIKNEVLEGEPIAGLDNLNFLYTTLLCNDSFTRKTIRKIVSYYVLQDTINIFSKYGENDWKEFIDQYVLQKSNEMFDRFDERIGNYYIENSKDFNSIQIRGNENFLGQYVFDILSNNKLQENPKIDDIEVKLHWDRVKESYERNLKDLIKIKSFINNSLQTFDDPIHKELLLYDIIYSVTQNQSIIVDGNEDWPKGLLSYFKIIEHGIKQKLSNDYIVKYEAMPHDIVLSNLNLLIKELSDNDTKHRKKSGFGNEFMCSADIGHGLSYEYLGDFNFDELLTKEIKLITKSESKIIPEKKIAILEDDNKQKDVRENMVKDGNTYQIYGSEQNVDAFEKYIYDGSLDMFLLDLQNGENDFAGWEILQKIVKYRHKNNITNHLKIILFSSNFGLICDIPDTAQYMDIEELAKNLNIEINFIHKPGFNFTHVSDFEKDIKDEDEEDE